MPYVYPTCLTLHYYRPIVTCREGDLLKHTSDGSSTRRYHFFLFTDSIAYGQQIFKGYYKFHRLVSIFDVSDPSEVSNDENRELQFIIKGDETDDERDLVRYFN